MAETFDYITVTTPDGSVQYKAPPMAAEFSATTNYAAGNYCTYQGTLYRFSADHAAGAWTGTDATAVSLAGDVSDLRSALSHANDQFPEINGVILPPSFEIGSRYVENGEEKWASSNTRLSFKREQYITLKEGDIVSKNASVITEFIGGYSTDNGTSFVSIPSRSSDFIAPSDGIYFFCLKKINTAAFDANDVVNGWKYITFTRSDNFESTTEASINDIHSDIDLIDGNVIDLTGEVLQVKYSDFVVGSYYYADNGQLKTSSSTSRMRYKNGVHLKPGDIIWLDYRLSAQFASLVYTTDGGTSYTGTNYSSPFVVVTEGDYYISARYLDNSVLTTELATALANGIKFQRGSGNEAVVNVASWAKDVSVGKYPNYKSENHLMNMLVDSSTYTITINNAHKALWVKLLPNTVYTLTQRVQIAGADAPRFALFNEEPVEGSVGTNYIGGTYNASSFSCTFKTTTDYVYAFLKYYTGSDIAAASSALDSISISVAGVVTEETQKEINNAKHVAYSVTQPLVLIHFSDLHKDEYALSRIVAGAGNIVGGYDDIICTGDMVGNQGGSIASWWDENILTCIGNHDSATYSGGTYNWTGVSMANRDAYYIAPFESGWGITHTSGTSYYYKDYTTQKVRLIVMDGMLYTDNGAEATAQTAWLESLLADAITNSLHVLIAIHAPHGGSTAEDCSFSRYAQGTMPTLTDCNTPQAVIDAVATKITGGLKFIGYIVGHTHQDNIWDAENDGKQMMYCITCANVSNNDQWKNSDQHRDAYSDAYNIVTVDTANTLIKIIRGGGADIDDHMRTRKAICFNYSTGSKVGEVL